MLDVRHHEEEMLARLTRALVDERARPPESGLRSLRTALDDHFGEGAAAGAQILPLRRRRLTLLATGVAASVVVLALVVGWYSSHRTSRSATAQTRIGYETAALRSDLRRGQSPARIEKDFSTLVQGLAALPASKRADPAVVPTQLMASACRTMEQGFASAFVPPACQTTYATPSKPVQGTESGTAATTDSEHNWSSESGAYSSRNGYDSSSAPPSYGSSGDASPPGSPVGPEPAWPNSGSAAPSGSEPPLSRSPSSQSTGSSQYIGPASAPAYQSPEQGTQRGFGTPLSTSGSSGGSTYSSPSYSSQCGSSGCDTYGQGATPGPATRSR